MKVRIIGSHLCPENLYALKQLTDAKFEVDFVDILTSLNALKTYLSVRESSPLYKDICGTDRLGIPCFVREDGSMTLDIHEIL